MGKVRLSSSHVYSYRQQIAYKKPLLHKVSVITSLSLTQYRGNP